MKKYFLFFFEEIIFRTCSANCLAINKAILWYSISDVVEGLWRSARSVNIIKPQCDTASDGYSGTARISKLNL